MSLHVERAGTGPDLVLLHGWGLHSGAWAEVAPELARFARVHAIDLPGHGHSAGVQSRTLDDAVDAIARAVPAGATLCGWSLGGMLAQRLVARHPARAARLALVATTPSFRERPGWPHAMSTETLEEFAAGLAQDRDGTLGTFVRLNALHGARGREAVRAFAGRLLERGAPSSTGLARGLEWLRTSDLRATSAAIALPTLVVHGARDALAPVEAGRWLAQHIAGARLEEIADAAHLPFFSHPRRFVAAMEAFVG